MIACSRGRTSAGREGHKHETPHSLAAKPAE